MSHLSEFTGLPEYNSYMSDIDIQITRDGFLYISFSKVK